MTKIAFGAASTAIQGAKTSLDSRALFGQSLPTLMAQMVVERESVHVKILFNSTLPVQSYSIFMPLGDIREFEKAGSIHGVLQSIAEVAGEKSSESREQLRTLTR